MNLAHYSSAISNNMDTLADINTFSSTNSVNGPAQLDLGSSDDLNNLVDQTIADRYRLTRVLGRGGMGVVYDAVDLIENRRVAIKILSSHVLSDEIAKKRFYREAKTGMALSHPNIVKTYNYGNHNDQLIYICMECVNYSSLGDYINRKGPITPKQLLSIVEQLCDALDYAHSNNVLHRDLKPSNIMLNINDDGEMQVKLADFGITKLLAPNEDITHGTNLTESGVVLGTVSYIAPEYLTGLDLNAVSDLYSLGVIVFEMLTDAMPVYGMSRQQELYNKIYRDIDPPSQSFPFLPASLDPVLIKMLSRNPLQRFHSGREFFEAYRLAVE